MDAWATVSETVSSQWVAAVAGGRLRPSTAARYSQILDAFCRYMRAAGVQSPETATTQTCRRFVSAPLRGGAPACAATSCLRLTVLRSAFSIMVAAGALPDDPSLGLRVHRDVPARRPVPLTPPEADRLLLAGRISPRDTLRPATVAMALLGATHREIADVTVDAFDERDQVLRVGTGDAARCVHVPSQMRGIVLRRATEQERAWRRRGDGWDPSQAPLALARSRHSYPVNSVAPTVSGNLARAIRCAGIDRHGVLPKSIREYAANAVYAATQRIEDVAEQLGLSSFDAAARLVDRAWQNEWGDLLRRAGTRHDG